MESLLIPQNIQLNDENSELISFIRKEHPEIPSNLLNILTFSLDLDEIGLINSDDAEEVLGYKTRKNFLSILKNNGILGTDYFDISMERGIERMDIISVGDPPPLENSSHFKREIYNLTPEFFKVIAIKSQKKEVYNYFILIEKLFKSCIKKYHTQQIQLLEEKHKKEQEELKLLNMNKIKDLEQIG